METPGGGAPEEEGERSSLLTKRSKEEKESKRRGAQPRKRGVYVSVSSDGEEEEGEAVDNVVPARAVVRAATVVPVAVSTVPEGREKDEHPGVQTHRSLHLQFMSSLSHMVQDAEGGIDHELHSRFRPSTILWLLGVLAICLVLGAAGVMTWQTVQCALEGNSRECAMGFIASADNAVGVFAFGNVAVGVFAYGRVAIGVVTHSIFGFGLVNNSLVGIGVISPLSLVALSMKNSGTLSALWHSAGLMGMLARHFGVDPRKYDEKDWEAYVTTREVLWVLRLVEIFALAVCLFLQFGTDVGDLHLHAFFASSHVAISGGVATGTVAVAPVAFGTVGIGFVNCSLFGWGVVDLSVMGEGVWVVFSLFARGSWIDTDAVFDGYEFPLRLNSGLFVGISKMLGHVRNAVDDHAEKTSRIESETDDDAGIASDEARIQSSRISSSSSSVRQRSVATGDRGRASQGGGDGDDGGGEGEERVYIGSGIRALTKKTGSYW